MEDSMEPVLLDSLARLYPLCKRFLLHWDSREFTGTQQLCLLNLASHGSMTMTTLAEAMACSKEQATRAAAPLVEKGYVRRKYDRDNRTRVWVELTGAGRTLLQREYAAVMRRLSSLSESDQQRLRGALNTVSEVLERFQP